MRVLYTADIHGRRELYAALAKIALVHKVQAILLGGDLLPNDFDTLKEGIRLQREFIVCDLFPSLERLQEQIIEIYLMLGNDDFKCNERLFEEEAQKHGFKPLHRRVYPLGSKHRVAGYSFVSPTPFLLKDWEKYEDGSRRLRPGSIRLDYPKAVFTSEARETTTIQEDLEALAKQVGNIKDAIFVVHDPPFDTDLDRLSYGQPVGSRAVRDFILTRQLYLTLHGHIHESPQVTKRYATRLGRTICVNPGQGVQLHAVIFDLEDIEGTLAHTIFGKV